MKNEFSSEDYSRYLAKRIKAELEEKTKNIDGEQESFRYYTNSADIGLEIDRRK